MDGAKAKTVTLDGAEYSCPFADLLPPLTADEYDLLRASVRDDPNGIHYPVCWVNTPTWGRTLVDGHHRVNLAEELSVPVGVVCLGDYSDEAAEQLARDLNDARRQQTPEAVRLARERRVERVAAKRLSGKSLREIAAEEGVSDMTVRNDLDKATAKGFAVEPSHVVGVNGKTYPPYRTGPDPPWWDRPVADLNIPGRLPEMLKKAGVKTLGDIANRRAEGHTFALDRREQDELDSALDRIRPAGEIPPTQEHNSSAQQTAPGQTDTVPDGGGDADDHDHPDPDPRPDHGEPVGAAAWSSDSLPDQPPPPAEGPRAVGYVAVATRPQWEEALKYLLKAARALDEGGCLDGPAGKPIRGVSWMGEPVTREVDRRRPDGGTRRERVLVPLAAAIRLVRSLMPAERVCAGCSGVGCRECGWVGCPVRDPAKRPGPGRQLELTAADLAEC